MEENFAPVFSPPRAETLNPALPPSVSARRGDTPPSLDSLSGFRPCHLFNSCAKKQISQQIPVVQTPKKRKSPEGEKKVLTGCRHRSLLQGIEQGRRGLGFLRGQSNSRAARTPDMGRPCTAVGANRRLLSLCPVPTKGTSRIVLAEPLVPLVPGDLWPNNKSEAFQCQLFG